MQNSFFNANLARFCLLKSQKATLKMLTWRVRISLEVVQVHKVATRWAWWSCWCRQSTARRRCPRPGPDWSRCWDLYPDPEKMFILIKRCNHRQHSKMKQFSNFWPDSSKNKILKLFQIVEDQIKKKLWNSLVRGKEKVFCTFWNNLKLLGYKYHTVQICSYSLVLHGTFMCFSVCYWEQTFKHKRTMIS